MKYTFNAEWFGLKVDRWIGERPIRAVAEDVRIQFATLHRIRHGQGQPTVSNFLTLCVAMDEDPLDFVFNEDGEPD